MGIRAEGVGLMGQEGTPRTWSADNHLGWALVSKAKHQGPASQLASGLNLCHCWGSRRTFPKCMATRTRAHTHTPSREPFLATSGRDPMPIREGTENGRLRLVTQVVTSLSYGLTCSFWKMGRCPDFL